MNYISEAKKLRPLIEKSVQSLDDTDALKAVTLYPHWTVGVEYAAGQRVQHGGVLYTVLMDHTSQADWTHDTAPSLFAKVLIPDESVVPAWEQPDSTNPYMAGYKVSHKDKIWVSDIDNNVWEPGVYGWTEVPE